VLCPIDRVLSATRPIALRSFPFFNLLLVADFCCWMANDEVPAIFVSALICHLDLGRRRRYASIKRDLGAESETIFRKKRQHQNEAVLYFLRRGRILQISCTASCHVPTESIVRLGLSMVAYSAFNDTLRRQLDPANDRPQSAQLMHMVAPPCLSLSAF
jgi:hypothetical protein